MDYDPQIAFLVESPESPSLEIRVNFGVYAGREATPAEIEELARRLLIEVHDIEIVSEERFEFGPNAEAQIHQVRIAVPDVNSADRESLLNTAELWARNCIEQRHAEVSEL